MAETMAKAWEGFVGGAWEKTIDVRDFIQKNYTPYEVTKASWLARQNPQQSCGAK